MFDDKTFLITGGTGLFGQAFVRKLLDTARPKKVVIFSRDELKPYQITKDFDSRKLRFLIGDVREKDHVRIARANVDYVVHAAKYNPMDCIKTNELYHFR